MRGIVRRAVEVTSLLATVNLILEYGDAMGWSTGRPFISDDLCSAHLFDDERTWTWQAYTPSLVLMGLPGAIPSPPGDASNPGSVVNIADPCRLCLNRSNWIQMRNGTR